MKTNAEFKNRLCGQFRNLLAVRAGVLLLCLVAASSPAQTYTVLHNFPNTIGSWPGVTLLSAGTTLYGTRSWGGSFNNGMIFTIDASGSGYTVLKNFTNGSDGGLPLGLVLSGATLYGTTFVGGSSNYGTVFKINTDGSGYKVLRSFTGYLGDGVGCNGGLLLSGATLYGTTQGGGSSGIGTVFKLNTDGSGYTVIKSFTGNDGAYPVAGLALSGTRLYGTTGGDGNFNNGTIYAVNTDGSGFVVLKSFTWTNNDGYLPQAGPILSDTTLYGTTLWAGGSSHGTVYKVNTDGSGYALLKQFVADSDGAGPQSTLVASGTMLYGMTWSGGISNYGTVFTINTDGSGFVVLKDFTSYSEGANPNAGILLSGTTLYGMTASGGSLDGGVVFSLSLPTGPPTILTEPASQTVGAGQDALFNVRAGGALPRFYQWFKDGVGVNDGGNLSGAHTDTLTLNNVAGANAGGYSVIVSNSYGSVTSLVATLTVEDPFINTQPVNQSVTAGQTALFSVVAGGPRHSATNG